MDVSILRLYRLVWILGEIYREIEIVVLFRISFF